MWLALRNLPSRNAFTASDLAHVSGATVHAAEHYLGLLVKQDIATRCGFTSERKAIFAVPKLFKEPVVLDAKGHPSRDYAIRRAAWTVMRMRSQFTIADLHDAVSEHITCARKQISAFVTIGRGGVSDGPLCRRCLPQGRIPPAACPQHRAIAAAPLCHVAGL